MDLVVDLGVGTLEDGHVDTPERLSLSGMGWRIHPVQA